MTRRAEPGRSFVASICGCMREATSTRPSTMSEAVRKFINCRCRCSSATRSWPTCATRSPGKAITEQDLVSRLDNRIREGDRVLLRTDQNNAYDGGSETWMRNSPYLSIGATRWLIAKGAVIVGYDFYHGNDEPDAPRVFHNSRTLSEHGVLTMPYLKNLDRIPKERFTLIAFPLNSIGAEASPVRAVALI